MHNAYVIKVKELRPHNNADRLQILTCFGNDVCVGLDVKVDQLGVYFPCDLQLSEKFCEVNHLCRKKKDGTPDTGYMDPDKRNVTAIRLRGEKSDGLFLPLHALDYCFADEHAIAHLKEGDVIDGLVNGHEICCKYIPRSNSSNRRNQSSGNRTRKHKIPTAPLFKEHADTEQLAYNLSAFKNGDAIEITLKMHGTSQRTGYLPVLQGYKDSPWCELRNAWRKMWHDLSKQKTPFEEKHDGQPIYDYGYVSGTRRVVLENYEGGFYGSNEFREQHSKTFEGKLWKGETVYYEVVGFTTAGVPIMGDANNKKLNDKEFIKQYGETTRFSYGCHPDGTNHLTVNAGEGDPFFDPRPQSDIYVYRMTMTNPDGEVVEYTPDFMRYRCEQMAVKCVPVMWKGIIPDHCASATDPTISAGEWIRLKAEQFYDGPDPIGKTHVREGVVVRILNRPKFAAYKHKNFNFKCLSGIAIAEVESKGEDIDESIALEM